MFHYRNTVWDLASISSDGSRISIKILINNKWIYVVGRRLRLFQIATNSLILPNLCNICWYTVYMHTHIVFVLEMLQKVLFVCNITRGKKGWLTNTVWTTWTIRSLRTKISQCKAKGFEYLKFRLMSSHYLLGAPKAMFVRDKGSFFNSIK